MSKSKILVVDDERLQRWAVRQKLASWGYDVLEAATLQQAIDVFAAELPQVVLLDLRLGDASGIEVLRKLKAIEPTAVIIMITAHGALDDAVSAFRLGLFDFMSKPVDFDALRSMIRYGLEARSLRAEVRRLRERDPAFRSHAIVGESDKVQALLRTMQKVASSGASTVLLQGESGTGKDLLAKALHYASDRADGPFIAVNCATLPDALLESELFGHERGAFTDARTMKKGLFEIADGGTLYLDEIGELKMGLQAKLLRVIESLSFRRIGSVTDVTVDVRIIAASNRPLQVAVNAGDFRPDLFYRLSVIELELPPLRERPGDIPLLVDHFIREYNAKLRKSISGATAQAMEAMQRYSWPGNIRELKNAIERAMIFEDGGQITATHLALSARPAVPSAAPGFGRPDGVSLESVEESLVRTAMAQAGGNQSQAARLLNIGRDALRYKLKKFGIATADGTIEQRRVET